MKTGQTNQQPDAHPSPFKNESHQSWGRGLCIAAAVVFCISSVFPVVAGLSKHTESFPGWWGPLDVGVAFFLAALAIAVMGLATSSLGRRADEISYRVYRVLIHGILLMCVVVMYFGDRIVWTHCITGLAWRTWLFLYCLPAWLTVSGAVAGPNRSQEKPDHEDAS